jgi:hypothetical protein
VIQCNCNERMTRRVSRALHGCGESRSRTTQTADRGYQRRTRRMNWQTRAGSLLG